MATGLMVVAAVVGLQSVHHGDNYCGHLLFRTVRSGARHEPMVTRTWTFLALSGNAAVMTLPTLLQVPSRYRRPTLAATAVALLALATLVLS